MLFFASRGLAELPEQHSQANAKTHAELHSKAAVHSKADADPYHNAAEKADTADTAIIVSAI